ncbi:MAG: diphosphate--fructose-6-phosphate 1-phosphotransferase [Candidatus Baltobacteraceae bacterium]
MNGDTLAILVGGGPAPGINGVIAAVTLEALRSGLRVVGLYDGYRHIARGQSDCSIELTRESVETVHLRGGSMLRTSRTNPAKDETTLQNCVNALGALNVRYLVTIGGDDTTYGATRIAQLTQGRIGVAAVPKTIDNDLPLPGDAPTFGFETARSVGSNIVESLLEDARTTGRWYLVISMGRKSGALALGMCRSAGATLAVVPEEFPEGEIDLSLVVDTIAGAMLKRRAMGRNDGVAVVAEGIAERLSQEQLASFAGLTRDSYGHIRLADVPLGAVLRDALRDRLKELGIEDGTVVPKDIGYELRCAKPVAFDLEYTRTLGYGAVRYLLEGGSGALIALSGGRATPLTLAQLQDSATGRVRVRMLDVETESYRIARAYQTRIEKQDLCEPALAKIAAQTTLEPGAFAQRFSLVP